MKNDAPGKPARTLEQPVAQVADAAAHERRLGRRMGDRHHRATQAIARRRQAIERGNCVGGLLGSLLDFLRGLLDGVFLRAVVAQGRRADPVELTGVVRAAAVAAVASSAAVRAER